MLPCAPCTCVLGVEASSGGQRATFRILFSLTVSSKDRMHVSWLAGHMPLPPEPSLYCPLNILVWS